MACRLAGAKPLSEPMLKYCELDARNKLQWNFNRNSYKFIQDSPFENVVWEMATILSRPQCVKSSHSNSFEDWAPVYINYGYSIFKWSLNQTCIHFGSKNVFENVICKMSTICTYLNVLIESLPEDRYFGNGPPGTQTLQFKPVPINSL